MEGGGGGGGRGSRAVPGNRACAAAMEWSPMAL